MIEPGALDIEADRWTPFIDTWTFTGIDLTDAILEAHIRIIRDATGTPLVDLDTVVSGSAQGLRLIDVDTTDPDVPISVVGVRINETTMEGLPAAAELGDDATLYWDMQITPAGGVKQVYLRGEFIVRAGVTH